MLSLGMMGVALCNVRLRAVLPGWHCLAACAIGRGCMQPLSQVLLQVVVERMAAKRHWPKVEIRVRAGGAHQVQGEAAQEGGCP